MLQVIPPDPDFAEGTVASSNDRGSDANANDDLPEPINEKSSSHGSGSIKQEPPFVSVKHEDGANSPHLESSPQPNAGHIKPPTSIKAEKDPITVLEDDEDDLQIISVREAAPRRTNVQSSMPSPSTPIAAPSIDRNRKARALLDLEQEELELRKQELSIKRRKLELE